MQKKQDTVHTTQNYGVSLGKMALNGHSSNLIGHSYSHTHTGLRREREKMRLREEKSNEDGRKEKTEGWKGHTGERKKGRESNRLISKEERKQRGCIHTDTHLPFTYTHIHTQTTHKHKHKHTHSITTHTHTHTYMNLGAIFPDKK